MVDAVQREVRDLEKCRRVTRRRIPIEAGCLVFVITAAWMLVRWTGLSPWFAAIPVGVMAFSLAGDVINVLFCTHRLCRLRSERGA